MNDRLEKPCVLNTRSLEQAAELTVLFEDCGIDVFEFPLLRIVPTISAVEASSIAASLEERDWLVFTSANGVRIVAQHVPLDKFRLAVIGEKTAKAVEDEGATVSFVSKKANSEGFAVEFIRYLKESLPRDADAARIFLFRGNIASEVLPVALSRERFEVKNYSVYDSCVPEISLAHINSLLCRVVPYPVLDSEAGFLLPAGAAGGELSRTKTLDMLVFTSSQAALNLISVLHSQELLGEGVWKKFLLQIPVAVIGAKTAKTVRSLGMDVVVQSSQPDVEVMVREACEFLKLA